MKYRLLFTLFTAFLFCSPRIASAAAIQQRSYTTIRTITVTPLSNGVQIRITADGILQYNRPDLSGQKMAITFPDARNGTGKTFINVNRYPLSYIQANTPPGAASQSGIGLALTINNFIDTEAQIAATPDGQGVIITVQSDRTIATGRGAAGGAATAAPQAAATPNIPTEVSFENGTLTLRALRADIHGLIALISQKTGIPVGVDDSVDRKVSLSLQNTDPETALQAIATGYGLALARVDGIWMLTEGEPRDLATYRLSGTQSFRMQNLQAATASGLLPNFLFSYVRVNSEQNAVVVTAPSQMLTKIGGDLNRVDIPPPQILIEAVVVEFTNTIDRDFGLNVLQQLPTSITTLDSTNGLISYSTIGKLPQTFDLTLKALELKGKARVRARPQMAVVNGRSADLFIGAQRFIRTQFNSFGQTQTRIQPVDVGVKLAITPLTGGNGEITTRIAPEVSNITELDLQTGLPVLSTRRADTTVRVKDGETIVIGGLTLNQEQTSNRKIPLLGDIPFLGNLFRSQKKNQVQTELVLFITPRLIASAPVSVPAPTDTVPPPGTAPPSARP